MEEGAEQFSSMKTLIFAEKYEIKLPLSTQTMSFHAAVCMFFYQ